MNSKIPRVVSVVESKRTSGCLAKRAPLEMVVIALWLCILGTAVHVHADVQHRCQDRGHFGPECSVAEVRNDRGRIFVDGRLLPARQRGRACG